MTVTMDAVMAKLLNLERQIQDIQNSPIVARRILAAGGLTAIDHRLSLLGGKLEGATFQTTGANVYFSAAPQTIVTATPTVMTYETVRYDDRNFANLSVNNDRLTIPPGLGGTYLIGIHVAWDTNTTGDRGIWTTISGLEPYNPAMFVPSVNLGGYGTWLNTVYERTLVAGDYIQLKVLQDSGGDRTISSGSLWIRKSR